MKVSESKYKLLVLYVDDILLAANDTDLLIKIKQLLFNHFDMKGLGEASYVLDIQILHDSINNILRLSQQTYIEGILKRFNMQSCSSNKTPFVKGDRFSKGHLGLQIDTHPNNSQLYTIVSRVKKLLLYKHSLK